MVYLYGSVFQYLFLFMKDFKDIATAFVIFVVIVIIAAWLGSWGWGSGNYSEAEPDMFYNSIF